MILLRSILAVVLGFLAMFLVVAVGMALAMAITGLRPQAHPTAPYLLLNLPVSLIGGAAGGALCRRTAPVNPGRFVLVLAFLVGALGVVGALRPPPFQPQWYCWTVTVFGVLGVTLGGGTVLRRRAI